MLKRETILLAFEKLGGELIDISNGSGTFLSHYEAVICQAEAENPWFTRRHILHALAGLGQALEREKLDRWFSAYRDRFPVNKNPLTVGVVMAGNVPVVGFHDFISVLLSGNCFQGKLSSDDRKLLPYIAERLIAFCPELSDRIEFTEERLSGFDAVIATGSNNTARYFDYYFGKYPSIIRKNRNGTAVLTGNETADELGRLGDDVFLYFGLGCRNVSKLYVPEGYDFIPMLDAFNAFEYVINTNKYKNNYDYYRSIFLVNQVPHLDNGIIMITESDGIASPPSVLYYETYSNMEALSKKLELDKKEIQCVISGPDGPPNAIPFGHAQKPELWDYADGVDTMGFLAGLG